MAPNDFGLNPSAPSSPSDGMTRKSLLLSEEAALAQDSAMDLLSRSMASQREISPSQGIAAALLAAIPTLGGYLIGKSVGTTALPSGLTNLDPSKLNPTGGYVGGLAGSQIGANASKDYTGAIETDNLHKQKVLAAEAQIENDRAQQLRQQANTVENAALSVDAKIAMMPLEMQQFAREQEIAANQQIRVDAARRQGQEQENTLPPEISMPIQEFLSRTAKGDPRAEESLVALDFSKLSQRETRGALEAIDTGRRLATAMRTEKQGNVDPTTRRSLAESKGLIDQLLVTAEGIGKFKNWAELEAARMTGNFDPNADLAAVADVADRVLRSRSGAAAPVVEQDRIRSFIAGDRTIPPSLVANFLKQAAKRENDYAYSLQQGAIKLAVDPTAELFSPPGTFGGGTGISTKRKALADLDAKIAALEAQITGGK